MLEEKPHSIHQLSLLYEKEGDRGLFWVEVAQSSGGGNVTKEEE